MIFRLKRQKQGEVHWSRDYVEHLRTSHFALVAAAAGLIALILTASPYDARAALTQVQQVLELKKIWHTEWVSAALRKDPKLEETAIFRPGGVQFGEDSQRNEKQATGNGRQSKKQAGGQGQETKKESTENGAEASNSQEDCPTEEEIPFSDVVYVQIPGRADPREPGVEVTEVHLHGAWSPSREWQERNELSGEFPASNLREMEAWWEALAGSRPAGLVIGLLKECVVFDYSGEEAYPLNCSLITHRVSDKEYSYRIWNTLGRVDHKIDAFVYFEGPAKNLRCNLYSRDRGAYWFTGWYPDHLVRMYASYAMVNIDQSVIGKALGVTPGPFEVRFGDLVRAGDGLESLPLEKLEDRLAEEVAKGSDTLEAFGLKLPAELVSNWGTLLLICGELYLIVYLRQLSGHLNNDDDGWNVPWMALEGSWLGQSMYAVSLAVAPVAIGLLRYHALARPGSHPDWVDWAKFLLLTFFGAALAFACWMYRPLKDQVEAPTG